MESFLQDVKTTGRFDSRREMPSSVSIISLHLLIKYCNIITIILTFTVFTYTNYKCMTVIYIYICVVYIYQKQLRVIKTKNTYMNFSLYKMNEVNIF